MLAFAVTALPTFEASARADQVRYRLTDVSVPVRDLTATADSNVLSPLVPGLVVTPGENEAAWSALTRGLEGAREAVDSPLRETLGPAGLVQESEQLTLAQVETLDAGSWFGDEFAGTRIPQLGEFLDLLAVTPHTRALIELKEYWSRDDIRSILDDVYARGVQNRVVFAGFHLGTITNLGDVAGAIPRVIIRRDLPADPVGLAQFYGAIAIMTSPWSLETYPDAVGDMHAAGLGVLVYTLNSEKRWTEATSYGVDGIVTDSPSELDGWLAATAPGT
jgi:glycerophosphoryl diester phosphodiesterase